jgi:glycosyltransferase involved in cell wall biosynthesis
MLYSIYRNRSEMERKSKQARKMMETCYSWEQMEKRLLSIYGYPATVQSDTSFPS